MNSKFLGYASTSALATTWSTSWQRSYFVADVLEAVGSECRSDEIFGLNGSLFALP